MSTTTNPTFDLDRFARAAAERDASTQLSMYAPDATYGRDMTHSVQHRVKDESGAAYTQACRYPDGTNVLCATVIELEGGLISGQTVVQVWDER
jgi:hypothetical protein